MKSKTSPTHNEINEFAEYTGEMITAVAEVADQKVVEAGEELAVALENVKKIAARAQEKAVKGVKATDKVIRENPYKAIGIAIGIGAVFGFLLRSRASAKID